MLGEALVNLVTSPLLPMMMVILVSLVVRLVQVPATNAEVLAVGIIDTRLAIAQQTSWRVAKGVVGWATAAHVLIMTTGCGHIKGVASTDPSH